jgi:hypothetical protein
MKEKALTQMATEPIRRKEQTAIANQQLVDEMLPCIMGIVHSYVVDTVDASDIPQCFQYRVLADLTEQLDIIGDVTGELRDSMMHHATYEPSVDPVNGGCREIEAAATSQSS